LNGADEKKLDFIDQDEEMKDKEVAAEAGKQLSGSSALLVIVFENIVEQFGSQLDVIRECKTMANLSTYLEQSVKDKLRAYYD
jgi:hypothetical protein